MIHTIGVVADPDRAERIVAVVGIIGAFAAWWLVGARPTRGPQRIGTGAETPDTPQRSGGDNVAGIGRFARPRSTRPRRLS